METTSFYSQCCLSFADYENFGTVFCYFIRNFLPTAELKTSYIWYLLSENAPFIIKEQQLLSCISQFYLDIFAVKRSVPIILCFLSRATSMGSFAFAKAARIRAFSQLALPPDDRMIFSILQPTISRVGYRSPSSGGPITMYQLDETVSILNIIHFYWKFIGKLLYKIFWFAWYGQTLKNIAARKVGLNF